MIGLKPFRVFTIYAPRPEGQGNIKLTAGVGFMELLIR
jgi:hypothetical protein